MNGNRAAAKPPLVRGLPFLGNAWTLRRDMTAFILANYERYGSVFRIRILGKEYVILGGLAANVLLSQQGNELFTGEGFFGGFAEQFHTDKFLPAMEGSSHRYLRKILRPGYSKEAVAPHGARLYGIAQAHVAHWTSQRQIVVVDALQRLVTDQLGIVLGGQALGDYFPYVRSFLRTIVNVTVLGTAPRFFLRLPPYQQARAKTREFLLQLIEAHRHTAQGGDLIDIALAARDLEGNAYSDNDLVVIGIGAYVAGMDTLANTLSFMLYALLKHPDAFAAVRAEADQFFAEGVPELRALRQLKALHGAAAETLRMYMIAPVTLRTAVQDFEFDGYTIPAGTNLMIANSVTHFLPQYFPQPHEFDIQRDYSAIPANVFTPFTLGAHTCLGAGMAQSLLMFTTAALLHQADFTLQPADFTAHIRSTPAPNPGKRFHVQVRKR